MVFFFPHYTTREAPEFFWVFLWFFFLRIIALQYCVGLCYTSKWTNHKYTHVPPPEPVSHFPPHLTPLGCHRAPCWAPCITEQISTCYFTHSNVYVSMLFSQFVPPSPSLTVHKECFQVSLNEVNEPTAYYSEWNKSEREVNIVY